jgi:TonB family protein
MKRFLLLGLLSIGMAAAHAQSAPIQASPAELEPVLKNPGSPKYPPLAKVARVSGKVKLEFVVNDAGDVASVMVVSGPAMLAPAAVDAVNAWKFQMPKHKPLEDLHLETVFDYVLLVPSPNDSPEPPEAVFDSFHHVTLTAIPPVISDGVVELCPSKPKGARLPAPDSPFLELSRSPCYGKWANPGATPLMRAAGQTQTAKVKRLLRDGASVFDADANGWTVLMYAAAGNDMDSLQMLHSAGADPNQSSFFGNTPLMVAAARGNYEDFSESLLRAGADLNAQNAAGTTTLMILTAQAATDEISAALKAGADARLRDKEERTALDYLHLADCGKNPIPEIFGQRQQGGKCGQIDEDSLRSIEDLLNTALGAAQHR